MKVYVVASDYGLNGIGVHGVYSQPPDGKEIQKFVDMEHILDGYFHVRPSTSTGYSGTMVFEVELDAPLGFVS